MVGLFAGAARALFTTMVAEKPSASPKTERLVVMVYSFPFVYAGNSLARQNSQRPFTARWVACSWTYIRDGAGFFSVVQGACHPETMKNADLSVDCRWWTRMLDCSLGDRPAFARPAA